MADDPGASLDDDLERAFHDGGDDDPYDAFRAPATDGGVHTEGTLDERREAASYVWWIVAGVALVASVAAVVVALLLGA